MDDSQVKLAIYSQTKGATPRQKGNWAEYGQAYIERENKIRSTWARPVSAKSKIKYYLERDRKIKKQVSNF